MVNVMTIYFAWLLVTVSFAQQFPTKVVPVQQARHSKRQSHVRRDVTADQTAVQQLNTLKALVDVNNYHEFGLTSLDDVKRLQLGEPLPVYFVASRDLANFKPGTDAGKILRKSERFLYPVMLDGKGTVVITIEKNSEKWNLVELGRQDIAGNLAKARQDKTQKQKTGPGAHQENYFAVQIPTLNELTFLAYAPPAGPGGPSDQKRQVLLTPLNQTSELQRSFGPEGSRFLLNNPSFNSEKEGSKSANEVFQSLVPTASKIANSNAPR